MFVTFQAGTTASTNGVTLASAGTDIRVYKVTVGTPVSAGNVVLYNSAVAVQGASTNIGFKSTLPTFSTTNINPGMYQFDFGSKGLPLDGGNLQIDQTMNVSVIWDYAPAGQQ